VLTRRSAKLRSHRGEVSFPGGRQDPGETLRATALREAHEEIALDPTQVSIIGKLAHLHTVTSRALIHPYVGVIPAGLEFVPNPDEVERVFSVSLSELIHPEVFREELWPSPDGRTQRPIWFFELEGDTVWGATAAMLRDLLIEATVGTT
jgi:8-oxo-dGTP pyrophosphatase MutT (NUDIX family)